VVFESSIVVLNEFRSTTPPNNGTNQPRIELNLGEILEFRGYEIQKRPLGILAFLFCSVVDEESVDHLYPVTRSI